MRRSLILGNWKMHGSRASVHALVNELLASLPVTESEIGVCPAHVHVAEVLALCAGSALSVGAQDCSHAQSGAYTGEVAPAMLADLGCRWVILGHSERRRYHSESDVLIGAKLAAAVVAGLAPVLCVGETLEQREAGEAEAVVDAQVAGVLRGQASLAGLVVAYEPVWAIGTGLTATPEQAQAMHAQIRASLARTAGVDAQGTRILYGGSVKADNAAGLFAQPDIDGALVGGAALEAKEFTAIAGAAR